MSERATSVPPEVPIDALVEHEPPTLLRFDRTERIVHWCNATLFLTLMATGAALYVGELGSLVGRRNLVEHIHLYAGLALPVPLLTGLLLRSGARLRADLGTIARWIPDDRLWWHRRTRARAQLGKFNPGQKLNASFVGAAIVVMLGTGSIMYWFEPFSDDVRTGATFVHDWFAFGVWLTVMGHIAFALNDRAAFDAMRHGQVPTLWARRKHPRWYVDTMTAGAPAEPAENASGTAGPIR